MFGLLHSATSNPIEDIMDAKIISDVQFQLCYILVSVQMEVM